MLVRRLVVTVAAASLALPLMAGTASAVDGSECSDTDLVLTLAEAQLLDEAAQECAPDTGRRR